VAVRRWHTVLRQGQQDSIAASGGGESTQWRAAATQCAALAAHGQAMPRPPLLAAETPKVASAASGFAAGPSCFRPNSLAKGE